RSDRILAAPGAGAGGPTTPERRGEEGAETPLGIAGGTTNGAVAQAESGPKPSQAKPSQAKPGPGAEARPAPERYFPPFGGAVAALTTTRCATARPPSSR